MKTVHPSNGCERPRNLGSHRVSRAIHRRPAVNLHHATRYAERLGLPLQLAVTINLTLMGVPPELSVLIFRTILSQRFAPWLRRNSLNRHGVAPTYLWVMESAGGQQAVHWLLHVPPDLMKAFRAKLHSWLSGYSRNGPLTSRAVNIQKVYSVIGFRRYMLKGTDPLWAKHLGVSHVPQGTVIGKRSGFSRNLGPTARKSGGYVPRRLPFQQSVA